MVVVEIIDPRTKIKYSYYMDGRLHDKLNKYVKPAINTKDEDMLFLIDGQERSGKSVLGQQLARFLDPSFSIDRVCMTPMEFKEAVQIAKKGQAIIYDEAYSGLSARGALTEINNMLISMMMEMGQKNLYVIIILPTFFMLEKYVALFRARGLFHVYRKGTKRGYWMYFNQRRKKDLYLKGKKMLSYNGVKSNMRGRFLDRYTVDEEEYRQKKKDALEGKGKSSKTTEKYKLQRDRLIFCLFKEMDLNKLETMQLLRRYDVFLGATQVRDIINLGEKFSEKEETRIDNYKKAIYKSQKKTNEAINRVKEIQKFIEPSEEELEEDDTDFKEGEGWA